jgi:hypothetical protein
VRFQAEFPVLEKSVADLVILDWSSLSKPLRKRFNLVLKGSWQMCTRRPVHLMRPQKYLPKIYLGIDFEEYRKTVSWFFQCQAKKLLDFEILNTNPQLAYLWCPQ